MKPQTANLDFLIPPLRNPLGDGKLKPMLPFRDRRTTPVNGSVSFNLPPMLIFNLLQFTTQFTIRTVNW